MRLGIRAAFFILGVTGILVTENQMGAPVPVIIEDTPSEFPGKLKE
jgi:hypothetical protein